MDHRALSTPDFKPFDRLRVQARGRDRCPTSRIARPPIGQPQAASPRDHTADALVREGDGHEDHPLSFIA